LQKLGELQNFVRPSTNLDGGMQKDSSKALNQQNKMQKWQNL